MFVAVAKFATAHSGGERVATLAAISETPVPMMRAVAFAAMLLLGSVSELAMAQIVAAPGSGAKVLQTQNGLDQVNIARPSSAGVSMNTYSQFDVQSKGAILNNSAAMTQTQQAG